jgi:hypothetical protein
MSVIENFAELSFKEQKDFAEALLKTINSENIFTEATNFELDGIEADEMTGGLSIMVSQTNPIEVRREASWTCDNEDDASDDPGFEATYENYLFEDAKKVFKTTSTVIDGYEVTLEIGDVEELDTDAEVEVTNISHEDDGIGDYEFWGERGHDSRPYVSVEGTITRECECSLSFFIEPAEATVEETEEN